VKTIPELISSLCGLGWKDVIENIIAYTGKGNVGAHNLILSSIEQSSQYSITSTSDSLTTVLFKKVEYDQPNASDVHFLSLFSGRVKVEDDLKTNRLFKEHVDPQDDALNPALFVVQRRDQLGHCRLLMYYDGALVCDCKKFQQFGFWCKHVFCLVQEGRIDFTASLAVDKSYADPAMVGVELPPVQIKTRQDSCSFKVTKYWTWGSEQAKQSIMSGRGASDMSVAPTAEPSEVTKSESKSKTRRDRLYALATAANSDPIIGPMVDEFLDMIDEKKRVHARSHAINNGRTERLNPLPGDKRKMELAVNKSNQF